jgi:hypothetical protein
MRPEVPTEIRELYLTPLPVDEFERRGAAAIRELDGAELDNLSELLGWFQRRYPTAKDRLDYVRRAYARWAGGFTSPFHETGFRS